MARKPSAWAKAAGEFYRKNKGKNGIESFTDVLKSSAFKSSYYAKHGKSRGRKHGGEASMIDEPKVSGGEGASLSELVPKIPITGGSKPDSHPIAGGGVVTDKLMSALNPKVGGKRRTKGNRRQSRKNRKTAKKGCFKMW